MRAYALYVAACLLTLSAYAGDEVEVEVASGQPDLQSLHEIWKPIALNKLTDEQKASCEKAIVSGRETAAADWVNKRAKIYAIEGGSFSQEFDPHTGLDIEYRSACRYPIEMFAWVDGYNRYLVEQIKEHGLPENSRLQWVDDITNPTRAMTAGKNVHQLTYLGEAVPGPNGTTLRWGIDEETRSYFYLYDADGEQLHKVFMGVSGFQTSINVAWGPEGSNLMYMQILVPYITKSYDKFYAIDFRTGKRLFSQRGPELPPVKDQPHDRS